MVHWERSEQRGRVIPLALGVLAVGCGSPTRAALGTSPDPVAGTLSVAVSVAHSAAGSFVATPAPVTPVEPLDPTLTFVNPRRMAVWRTQDGAVLRGSIAPRSPFEVQRVLGPADNCSGAGWAELPDGSFVCLRNATPTDAAPFAVGATAPDSVVPFIYARPRARDQPVPMWSSKRTWRRKHAPSEALLPYGSYAFSQRLRLGRTALYANDRGGVVQAADVRRHAPSEFAGRNLETAPLAPDHTVVWSIGEPAIAYAEPPRRARSGKHTGELPFHEALDLPARTLVDDDAPWVSTPRGFIARDELRVWLPVPPPPEDIAAGAIWIDVELRQQTLTLLRGDTPIFVTLVSSGRTGGGTPPGVFRIHDKWAYTTMESAPDAERPYSVEAVPWAQFFDGEYALHGAYWHDRFGKRKSHGCINLAPQDAERVFGQTAPHAPEGWLGTYERPDDPGTVVRIRKHGREPADRRVAIR